jgi:hypothetical protein
MEVEGRDYREKEKRRAEGDRKEEEEEETGKEDVGLTCGFSVHLSSSNTCTAN